MSTTANAIPARPPSNGASRMSELAGIISARTKEIEDYLAANNLPPASFDVDAPADLIPPDADEKIQKARTELIDATTELKDLATGARTHVMHLGWDGNYNNLSLQSIWHYKLALLFPPDSTTTYAALSRQTGLSPRTLQRLLRHAMTNRLFTEPSPGVIAHTRASKLIHDDRSLQGWLGLQLGTLGKPAAYTIDAMEKWKGSEDPMQTGVQLVYGEDKHWFNVLGEDESKWRDWSEAMRGFSEGVGYGLEGLVDGYPWEKFAADEEPSGAEKEGDHYHHKGLVVDVGGGIGDTSVALAKAFPGLKFINQDLPGVLSNSYEKHIPEDLRDRISFVPYDFFTPQPVKDADAYLFRWIFHGWSDAYAVKILQSQVPALKKGARIIINEWTLPYPGEGSLWDERLMRVMDLTLMTCVNSNERDLTDWKNLFARADSRFTFLGSSRPEGCKMWITEAVWDPDDEYSTEHALPGAKFPVEA